MVNPIFTGEALFDRRLTHKCEETQNEVCTAGLSCNIDIVVLWDITGWNEPGIFDQLERIIPFGYFLNRAIKQWRIALITFDEEEATVEMELAKEIGTYESTLNYVKPANPTYGNFDENRALHGALDLVIDEEMGSWKPGAERLVIVVTNGMPDDENGRNIAIANAQDLNTNHNVRIETIQTGYYEQNSTVPTYQPGVEDFLISVAAPSGGSNVQIHVNGQDELNFGVDTNVNASFQEKISELCNPPEREEDDAKCCGILPCRICLRWEVYEEETVYDHLTLIPGTNTYTANIDGMQVRAFRKANANCIFIIEVDGVEIFSAPECPTFNDDGSLFDEDEVTVSCRDPRGSVEFTRLVYPVGGGELEEVSGTFHWEVEDEWMLQERRKQPSGMEDCRLDVAVFVENTFHLDEALYDLQRSADAFISQIESQHPSYTIRYALIWVGRSTHGVATPFGDKETFKTELLALSPRNLLEEPSGTPDNYCNIGIATEEVWDDELAGAWDPNAYRWIVYHVHNGPHYGTENSNTTPQNRLSTYLNARVPGFTCLSGSFVGRYNGNSNPVIFPADLETYWATLSKYTPDGPSDLNGGASDIVSSHLGRGLCLPIHQCSIIPGKCADNFCGNCVCVCNKICVDIQLDTDTFDSECRGFIDFDGEICNDRAQTAEWRGTVAGCQDPGYGAEFSACSWAVEVILYRADEDGYNEHSSWNEGDCLADIIGDPGSGSDCPAFSATVKIDCPNLSATFTIPAEEGDDTSVIVTIHCLRCGSCTSVPLPCCPGFPVVPTLNFYVVQQSTCGDCNQPDPAPLALMPPPQTVPDPNNPLYVYQAVIFVPENDDCEGGGGYYVMIDFECRNDADGGVSIGVHSFIVPGPGEDPPSVPFDGDDIPAGAQSIYDTLPVDADCELPFFAFDLSLCGGFGAAPADGSANPGNAIGIVTVT